MTPTFNRGYIIGNLYNSLLRQTFNDFEWLIIDDGSTDETESLIQKFKEECEPFTIRYFKQANGGKCRAINHALDKAQGELFFVVDSDDYLTDDALEKIDKWINELPKNDLFCGVAGNLGTSAVSTRNPQIKGGYYDGTLLDRYKNMKGERALALYTDIHKQYRYPEIAGENFMTEAVVWNRMANDGFKVRFFNDIIWIYEYREDGLTKAGKRVFLDNPQGYILWLKEKWIFTGANRIQLLKFYYSISNELLPVHGRKKVSEFLHLPAAVVSLFGIAHKIKRATKRF